ncbi:hypothetical protein KSU17_16185 [Morganella morganii]|nr:hypothetical protein [Morganella morganii]MCU6377975.1 hypothetical protein [Morganella morganii]
MNGTMMRDTYILSFMYIPCPAKLLFTINDGWNRHLEKHGNNVSLRTRLCVERMLACGTCAMGIHRYSSNPLIVRKRVSEQKGYWRYGITNLGNSDGCNKEYR